MATHSKTYPAIAFVLLALVSASAGYLLRAQKTDGSLVLPVEDVVRVEYLAPPDSFSRVENTKNTLEALCIRLRLGIQESAAAYNQLVHKGETSNSQAAVVLDRAIREAEAAEREFAGTEQQLYILQDHLRLLDRAGRFDLWTRLYLKALYEHPTHLVVSRLAKQAVRIGKMAGHQEQVLDALRYLSALPEEFAGRSQIETLLRSVQPQLAKFGDHQEQGGVGGTGAYGLMK